MNYTELYNTIQSYTENQFPDVYLASASTVSTTTQINTFITQAEQRIYNSVQFPSLRKNVTGFTTTSNKYLACPSDFLASYSMAVIAADGSYEYLLNKDVNFIRQAYPQPTDTAIPKYYALFGPSYSNRIKSFSKTCNCIPCLSITPKIGIRRKTCLSCYNYLTNWGSSAT